MARAVLALLGLASLLAGAMRARAPRGETTTGACALIAQPTNVAASTDAIEVSERGIALVEQFEGFAATPHWDHARWSVGYGSRSDDGRNTMSEAEADAAVRREAKRLSRRIVAASVVPLAQHQIDALTSFAYNVGESALLGHGDRAPSTLWTFVQSGRMDDAAAEFERWNKAGGRVVRGLVTRRRAEAALFRGDGAGNP